MNFNPDLHKQAEEVIFSRKINKINHPPLLFNPNLVKSSSTQKHLGMVLDNKLDLKHLKNVQTIGLLRKLQNILPRESLITIYKSFRRPHLDYGDVIYDNLLSKYRINSIQWSVSNYGCNKRNFKRKNLSRIRF